MLISDDEYIIFKNWMCDIQLNFSMGSAMVSTSYTWMVVGQEAIEAGGIA